MESEDSMDSGKLLSFSNFSLRVNRFTLKFKDEPLETEFPTKSISPFSVTVFFRIFLCLLIFSVGARRVEMIILTINDHSLALGTLRSEVSNISIFVGAILLEVLVYFYKPAQLIRGFFIMTYMYASIAFSSYYTKSNSLFSTPM